MIKEQCWLLAAFGLVLVSSPVFGRVRFERQQELPVGSSPRSVAVGDFNRDDIDDLATTHEGSSDVTLLISEGTGHFAVRRTPVGQRPEEVLSADINGDHTVDLAVLDPAASGVWLLLGRGDGTFDDPSLVTAGIPPADVAITDLDGDRDQDLAVVDGSSNRITPLLQSVWVDLDRRGGEQ
jgi:hypothetical protein